MRGQMNMLNGSVYAILIGCLLIELIGDSRLLLEAVYSFGAGFMAVVLAFTMRRFSSWLHLISHRSVRPNSSIMVVQITCLCFIALASITGFFVTV